MGVRADSLAKCILSGSLPGVQLCVRTRTVQFTGVAEALRQAPLVQACGAEMDAGRIGVEVLKWRGPDGAGHDCALRHGRV